MAREPGPSKEKSPSALNSVTDHDSTLLGEVRRLLTRLDVLSGLHTASGHAIVTASGHESGRQTS